VRKRIAREAKVRSRELFVELNHRPSRTAVVLGSGRSGTTWLAESIARQYKSRLLFEPFNPRLGVFGGDLRLFPHPTGSDPAFERAVRRVLSGQVRTVNIDQVLTARLPRSRIVKDVHATNLLPWFRANYPTLPIIFTVRNPIAVSLSRLRTSTFYGLGHYLEMPAGRNDAEESAAAAWLQLYDTYRTHTEPLVGLVAEWCMENVYPLSRIDDTGAALAFYETIVLDPVAELGRLGELCNDALGPARRAPLTAGAARKPSAMDWFGTAAAAHQSGDWSRLLDRWTEEVPRPVVDQCLRVLADFGLDSLYGDGPMPIAGERSLKP
jgi:Sulfotransferase family